MLPSGGGCYGGAMALSDCHFATDRLIVGEWSRLLTSSPAEGLRNDFVVSLLTEAVTRDLPPQWQGAYDADRASQWFVERQSESTVLLVVERSDGHPVGLLILSASGNSHPPLDVRVGYMIKEGAWDRGLASEVVAGLADWCRASGVVRSVIGGVAEGNQASARVLTKNGFVPLVTDTDDRTAEAEFILTLTP